MKRKGVLFLALAVFMLIAAYPCAADAQEVLEQKKSDAEACLNELNGQFTELTHEYDELQVKYEDTCFQLRQLEEQLASARGTEAEQREGMKTRIRYMYENTADMAGFSALLSADGFMEFLTAADNMNELSKYDRQMLEQYQNICDLIEETQSQVEREQKSVAELKKGSLDKQEEIKALIEQTADEVEQYSAEIEIEKDKKMQELLAQLQSQTELASALVDIPADAGWVYYGEAAELQPELAGMDFSAISTAAENADVPDEGIEEEPRRTGGYSENFVPDNSWEGSVLTATAGVNQGPTGRETYYNMEMAGVVDIMRGIGNTDDYWVRDDGVKMLGDYVMVAANLDKYPRGSVVDSSLGKAIVCDTGGFAAYNADQLDIAVSW